MTELKNYADKVNYNVLKKLVRNTEEIKHMLKVMMSKSAHSCDVEPLPPNMVFPMQTMENYNENEIKSTDPEIRKCLVGEIVNFWTVLT